MEVRASWLPLGKQESKGRACVDNLRAEQNGFVAMVVRIAAGREAKQEERSVWVTNSTVFRKKTNKSKQNALGHGNVFSSLTLRSTLFRSANWFILLVKQDIVFLESLSIFEHSQSRMKGQKGLF